MENVHDFLDALVKQVVAELGKEEGFSGEAVTGLYDTVDEEVESAVEAQKRLIEMSVQRRCEMIASIRKAVLDNNEMLSALAVRDTKLGRYEDKIRENILCATKTPGVEDIEPSPQW